MRELDPARKVAVLSDGSEMPYDLFLGVPVHRVPAVVAESGLTVDGWVPVNSLTLETAFPGVYAVGDVTSVGTPKAGVFAEGQAAVVADAISAAIRGATGSAAVRRARDVLPGVRARPGCDGGCHVPERGAAGRRSPRTLGGARGAEDRVRFHPDPPLVRSRVVGSGFRRLIVTWAHPSRGDARTFSGAGAYRPAPARDRSAAPLPRRFGASAGARPCSSCSARPAIGSGDLERVNRWVTIARWRLTTW